MWILTLVLGLALLLGGIFARKLDKNHRLLMAIPGGILAAASVVYFVLVVLLVQGIA